MSATHIRLEFSAVVEDYEHWRAADYIRCTAEGHDGTYDGWVSAQLRDVMHKAGQAFIDANRDLFRTPDLM